MNDIQASHPDLTSRADIERLVNTFYDKIRRDDLLGFIFNDVAQTDWAAHLPKYVGNAIGKTLAAAAAP